MTDQEPLMRIPDKIYFTIGEVAKLCHVEPHVLRYWEQEFPQLSPSKRRKRRYYQRKDVVLVRRIRELLYEERFSIKGARRQLEGSAKPVTVGTSKQLKLKQAINDLESVLTDLS